MRSRSGAIASCAMRPCPALAGDRGEEHALGGGVRKEPVRRRGAIQLDGVQVYGHQRSLRAGLAVTVPIVHLVESVIFGYCKALLYNKVPGRPVGVPPDYAVPAEKRDELAQHRQPPFAQPAPCLDLLWGAGIVTGLLPGILMVAPWSASVGSGRTCLPTGNRVRDSGIDLAFI